MLKPQALRPQASASPAGIDTALVLLLCALLSVGIVMIASASVSYAQELTGDPLYFMRRQLVFLLIGLSVAALLLLVPSELWRSYSWLLVLLALGLMILVLIPGVGREVNGSRRWLQLGPVAVQASEVAKFAVLVFAASFIDRNQGLLQRQSRVLLRALLPIVLMIGLLLAEPDLGGAVVLLVTALAMLFVAGARLRLFFLMLLLGLAGLGLAIMSSPYRMQRLVAYLDPWADQFNSGYQLTQSLIAVGRGEWFGVGLGNSVQKLLYLPEAHTDFIFSIFAEEFGLLGGVILLGGFVLLIARLLICSRRFLQGRQAFAGYLTLGVAILITLQVFINIGVATGLLPTKGLTLPFISYGGSSLVVMLAVMSLVLRLQWEQAREGKKSQRQVLEVRYG